MMTKIRLLIIEEHKAVRQALLTRLRSSPMIEVIDVFPHIGDGLPHTAESSLNGRQRLADVALLSIKQSNERYFERTLRLIEDLVSQGTAVIVLTPYADDIEQELLLEAGASRYLLKNVNTPQLITEIESVNRERAKAAVTLAL